MILDTLEGDIATVKRTLGRVRSPAHPRRPLIWRNYHHRCRGDKRDNRKYVGVPANRATAHYVGASKFAVKPVSCSIVIPAYNEAQRLPLTLQCILSFIYRNGWDSEVIVVNDGSTDNTAEIAREFSARCSVVRVIDNIVNQGKGRSIRDGVLHATKEIVLFTDADNSTPIEDAEKLVAAITEGSDIAIGSRWVNRKLQRLPQPLHRRLNGRLYNRLLRAVLGLEFRDTQNGFKAFTRQAAIAIFSPQRISGWGFDAEALFLANKLKLVVCEVPVEYTYCAEGSKIHPYRDGARMLVELLKVKWYWLSGAYSTISPIVPPPSDKLCDVPMEEG